MEKEGRVHLICPSCNKDTSVNGDRFIGSKYNVWCNGCLSRFKIDLRTGYNCRVSGEPKGMQVSHMLFDAGQPKWIVVRKD